MYFRLCQNCLRKEFSHWLHKKGEKGSILVATAILLPLLFLFVGVAVDTGRLYVEKGRLQHASDSGVLASLVDFKKKYKGATGRLVMHIPVGAVEADSDDAEIKELADMGAEEYIRKNTKGEFTLGEGRDKHTGSYLYKMYNNDIGSYVYYYEIVLGREYPVYFLRIVNETNLLVRANAILAFVLPPPEQTQEISYLEGLETWGAMLYENLLNEDKTARIQADLMGLKNIATFFNQSNMSFFELAGNPNIEDGYLRNKHPDNLNLGENADQVKEGSTVWHYWTQNDSYLSGSYDKGALEWMKGNMSAIYESVGPSYKEYSTERYFFSNEMASNDGKEKQVRVAFTQDASGNVTGTKVWVSQQGSPSGMPVSAINNDGESVAYSVYVQKQ